jgi:hypothetical protein
LARRQIHRRHEGCSRAPTVKNSAASRTNMRPASRPERAAVRIPYER